jgi:fructose-1,6-bisphosphatase/sedoheptulose 1,7-bisphosphatase-like protein
MPTSASTAERIRDAIAEVYAAEPSPDQLATVAAAHGLGLRDILLWIHDRPRHEMSAAHFLLWCERYGFLER